MKVSTKNDNNFEYEKITIVVDNIPLIQFFTLKLLGQINSMSHGYKDKLNRKGPTKAEFQYLNFLIFHSILMQFLAKLSSLWVIDGPEIVFAILFLKGFQILKFNIFGRHI